MPAIMKSESTGPAPIETLKAAVAWARKNGWRVRIGTLGGAAVSTRGGIHWERDDMDRDPGVSPVGACILLRQPPARDPYDAAAQSLGVDRCWVEGLLDGLGLEPKDAMWMQSRRRAYYLHGFESGILLRIHVVSKPESV